jgi:hypothetical protein
MLQRRREGLKRIIPQVHGFEAGKLLKDIGKCGQLVAYETQPLQTLQVSNGLWDGCQAALLDGDLSNVSVSDLNSFTGPISVRGSHYLHLCAH